MQVLAPECVQVLAQARHLLLESAQGKYAAMTSSSSENEHNKANRRSLEGLADDVAVEDHELRPAVAYPRLTGCLGGCSLGCISSLALLFLLLVLDQVFSKPTDPDFMNPIGGILLVLLAAIVGAILGTVLYPPLAESLRRRNTRNVK